MEELVPPEYLSPSSIATFQQCPLKYKYSRIDKLTEPPTEATLRGNFVHSILEELYRLPQSDRTVLVAKQLAKQIWDEQYEELVTPYVRGDDALRSFRWTSWWCVENLFKMEEPSSIDFDGLETELNGSIDGVSIKGFIDRWRRTDDGIVIGDYKTGKPPSPRFADDKHFQLALYACVLELQIGETVSKTELLFIRDSVRFEKQVTNIERENVRNTVVTVRKEIEQRCSDGYFEPRRMRLCDWCSYKTICPAWSN